jgi:predicted RNA-binding protein with PIN domain
MTDLPSDVSSALVRAVAAFVRSSNASELPKALRPVAKVTYDKALARHRNVLLGALEDEAMRTRLGKWLSEDPGVRKADAELLRIAVERPDGWEAELRATTKAPPIAPSEASDQNIRLQKRVEAERARARRLRADAAEAHHDKERAAAAHATETARLQARVDVLEDALATAGNLRDEAIASAAQTENDSGRELRRARARVREAERATADARGEARELRAQVRTLENRVRDLSDQVARMNTRRRTDSPPGAHGLRRPLSVPAGLLGDARETLEVWLATPGVSLLVDGYNVTKAPGGFGDLTLEDQRRRLLQPLINLVRRFEVEAVIVYDGDTVSAGVARVARGPVRVEYSKPHETADDHLVARLQGAPASPVIVVTNDRELQRRATALGATIATSGQLLSLLN